MFDKDPFLSVSLQQTSRYSQNEVDQQLSKNQFDILNALKHRQKLIKTKSQFIKKEHRRAVNQIQKASPSKIKISKSMNPSDYQILKQIVGKAFLQSNLSQKQKSQPEQLQNSHFIDNNKELEQRISENMKQLQDVQLAVRNNEKRQNQLFLDFETQQQKLKRVLLQKGSLIQAEMISKVQQQCKNKIIHNKNITQSLKQKKANMVKNVLSSLQNLNRIRKQYVENLQKCKGSHSIQSYKLEEIIEIIQQFKQGISELQVLKSNSKSQIQSMNINRSSTNTPINAFYSSQQNQVRVHPFISKNSQTIRKNAYEQQTKSNDRKIQQKNQKNVRTPQQNANKQYQNIDQIIQKYDSLITELSNCGLQQSNCFRQLEQYQNKSLRILAIEKVYVKGVIGSLIYQHKKTQAKQQSQIEIAIQKCSSYQKSLTKKLMQMKRISQKIKNVEQTHVVFQQMLQSFQKDAAKKRQLVRELQKLERQWQEQQFSYKQRKSQKDFLFDRQNYRIKIMLLDKQIQQCARMADLQGYKKVKRQMDILESKIKSIENQMQQNSLLSKRRQQFSDDNSKRQKILAIFRKLDLNNAVQEKRQQLSSACDCKGYLKLLIRRLTFK